MKKNSPPSERYNIQVLQKALRILDVLLEARHPLGLEEISHRAQTPKSTAFRIITNLLKEDYLSEASDGYWLGLKLLSLGSAVESSIDFRQVAEPYMHQLRDDTGETVYLATLMHDMQVLYVDRAASLQPVAVMLKTPGMTNEVYCSGLGKVMLAYQPASVVNDYLSEAQLKPLTPNTITDPNKLLQELAAIRERGYSIDDEESMPTICCIAAPIFDAHERVVGAISVAGPKQRVPHPLLGSDLAQQVVSTAQQISAQLGLPVRMRTNGKAR